MSYSGDLRKRVLEYVKNGGKKVEAARIYGVSRWCVYEWLSREEALVSKRPGPKTSHKFNREELLEYLKSKPDATLKEMSLRMGVGITAIWNALKRMNISRKKNMAIY